MVLVCYLAAASADPYAEFRNDLEVQSTNLDDPAYRLQNIVQPREYYVDLDVYLEESRFNGLVQILVDVRH